MNVTLKKSLICACALVVILSSTVETFARRPWRREGRGRASGTSGLKVIAPKSDSMAGGLRRLRAYFDYDPAMTEEMAFTDRLRVFVRVADGAVLNTSEPIVAEVKLTDLANEAGTATQFCSVSFQPLPDQEQLAVFDVANEGLDESIVRPGRVYRMFVNLHRQTDTYTDDTALGSVPLPYYAATAGETRLGRARRHIAMRTFKEFYFAQNGWDTGEQYPMDCYAYYMWATGSVTVGAQNRRTILDRLFGAIRPFRSGNDIAEIAQLDAIHGDYVRIPGHSFMLLAHDPDQGHVWTMEGNFNSTVEIVVRSPDSGWTVGHLVDEHIQPELFQVSRVVRPEEMRF